MSYSSISGYGQPEKEGVNEGGTKGVHKREVLPAFGNTGMDIIIQDTRCILER